MSKITVIERTYAFCRGEEILENKIKRAKEREDEKMD
jgi:hypothetical protein